MLDDADKQSDPSLHISCRFAVARRRCCSLERLVSQIAVAADMSSSFAGRSVNLPVRGALVAATLALSSFFTVTTCAEHPDVAPRSTACGKKVLAYSVRLHY
jgi:hypothetical protein